MKISTTYQGGMRFSNQDSIHVVMDAALDSGGKGEAPTPKQLVLHGLAGCTGMDVATILAKKGVTYESFSIDVEAEQTTVHPKVFKQIKVTYRFVANPSDRPAIERAVELSRGTFCGVSAMLEKTAEIETAITIDPTAN
jgi:putative redox protein